MKWIATLLIFVPLSACASLKDMARERYCNENGSFEKGMNDARNGENMNTSFASLCEEKTRPVVQKSYREGYLAGIQSKKNEPPSGTQINVNVGGTPPAGAKNVLCRLKPFTEQYEAWGASETDAKLNVKALCVAHNHEMHCKSYKCKTAEQVANSNGFDF